MKKTISIIIIITFLSKISGLLRLITLSYFYGANSTSDAFLISLTISGTLFSIIGVAISTGFIPIFSKILIHKGKVASQVFVNKLINLMLLVSTFIVLISLLFPRQIIYIFASGLNEETLSIAIIFLRITIFTIYFNVLVFIFTGYFHSSNKFLLVSGISIPTNIIIILSIYLSKLINYEIIAYGYLFAMAFEFILLLPAIYKSRFRYKFTFNFLDHDISSFFILVLPIFFSTAVDDINKIIDKQFASGILGGISSLSYAARLNQFIIGLFVLSITSVIFPKLNKYLNEKRHNEFSTLITNSILSLLVFLLPATIGSIFFSNEIVMIIYGRGVFDSVSVSLTSSAFLFYSIGLLAIGIKQIYLRAFFSLQDTKSPLIFSLFSLALNFVLNLFFFFETNLGIGGLALSTSISNYFIVFLLHSKLNSKIERISIKNILFNLFKLLLASISIVFFAKFIFNIFYFHLLLSQTLSFTLSVFFACIAYLIILPLLNISQFNKLKKVLLIKIIRYFRKNNN